jgi:hypothetical protein
MTTPNILQAIHDDQLLRPFFDDLGTWENWQTALQCIYGLPVSEAEHEVIWQCTGRAAAKLPASGFDTVLLLTGRRSGKSRIAASIGAFEACLAGHEHKLAKGEHGVVVVCAPTKPQGRTVKDAMRAALETPILANEVASETREGFELKSGTRIEILAGDWKTVRSYTLLAAIVDEAAFFGYGDDLAVKSDTELIRAMKPGLATVGGKLIAISTPYARKGWCYSTWKKHYGKDGSKTLVWHCESRTMNPCLPEQVVTDALAEDEASARAEYLGHWREDIESFVSRALIESLVVSSRRVLPPERNVTYFAFCDPSGGGTGKGADSAALAIGHKKGRTVILDLLQVHPPPNVPEQTIRIMADTVHSYGIGTVYTDRYAPGFVNSAFERHGLTTEREFYSPWKRGAGKEAKSKSDLYLELLPVLRSGRVELLDDDLLVNQLCSLQRKVTSGGRDHIDHAPGEHFHDDAANAVAGCVVACLQKIPRVGVGFGLSARDDAPDLDDDGQPPQKSWWRRELEFYRNSIMKEQEFAREVQQDPLAPLNRELFFASGGRRGCLGPYPERY